MRYFFLVLCVSALLGLGGCGMGSVGVVERNRDEHGSIATSYRFTKQLDEVALEQLGVIAINDAFRANGTKASGMFFLDWDVDVLNDGNIDKDGNQDMVLNACVTDHFTNWFGSTLYSCVALPFVGNLKIDTTTYKCGSDNSTDCSLYFFRYTPRDEGLRQSLQKALTEKIQNDTKH